QPPEAPIETNLLAKMQSGDRVPDDVVKYL
ncbi:unnamed protein product, partial [marine sediment metagenome]